MNHVQSAETAPGDEQRPHPDEERKQTEHHAEQHAEHITEHALETARALTHQAGDLATRAAEHIPAAVVVIVGGTVLLAADAFGIGEIITAGVAGYAAYRLLRRRARARALHAENAETGHEAQP